LACSALGAGALALAFLVTGTASSRAAGAEAHAASEPLLLFEVLLLVVLARLLGEVMIRLRQPAVMGHLLAGILLGPSVLGVLWPSAEQFLFPADPIQKAAIGGISQFGILMLLLLAGMETDLALVRRVRRAAISASTFGIAFPFLMGFLLGLWLPENLLPDPGKRILLALFLGTALSISSVKIVATVVRDMGFLRRDIGQVILASAIVDDTIGWIIIAITLSLAESGSLDWMAVGKSVFGTIAFLAVSFSFGRRAVFKAIQWTNDIARGEAAVVATIIALMAAMALITSAIGVSPVLGAFIAGILVGESPILTDHIDEQLRGLTAGLFMPVFFGLSGLNADLTVLGNGEIALFTVALVAIASLGKATGAFCGAWLGGLRFPQALALAAGMNARGSTEIIVASIGLSIGVLSQNLFTMIVAMAFITTTAMPPMLRWALARLPMHEEERKRLDRETIDAQSVLAGWERLLLAADASPTGQLAARFAGLLSGARRMPVTVLSADGDAEESEDKASANDDSTATAAIVKASAEGAAAGGDAPAAPIDVVERHHSLPWPEAIAAEAAKGYDLLILGMEPVVDATGDFDSGISRLARSFPGSLAVVSARGRMELKPVDARMQILIPVTGSQVARYGAEMGLALAKAAGTKATALTVILPETRDERPRYSAHARDAGETAKEITAIAEAMDQPLRIAKRTNISPENAILREARLGAHDLIVLGVSRRPGDQLSFGGLAAALLDSSDRSLLFLALQPTAKKESAPAASPPSSPPPDAKAGNPVRKTDGKSAGSKNGGSKNGVRKKRKAP
jgi:Kef-type K+ transport system membrane component KefB/nucleotide-binding universal stress UspA family protein